MTSLRKWSIQLQGFLGLSVNDYQEGVHPPPPLSLELRLGVCTTCRRFFGRYLAAMDAGQSHTHSCESPLLVNIRIASDKYSANSEPP